MKAVSIALYAQIAGCAFVQPVSAAEPAKYTETVLHSFGSAADGQNPYDSVIDKRGRLYGTTYGGGSFGGGAAFALNLNTRAETVLYSFCSALNCTDGENPVASLIDVKGTLYGTTQGGGSTGAGTAFAVDAKTGAETVLYTFCSQSNCADGQNPNPALIKVDGTLYGTTVAGGAYCGNGHGGCGTVYSLDPNTGAETVLHSFGNGADGQHPDAGLIAVNGILYGTTGGGGSTDNCTDGCGTVFSVDPSTSTEKVLYSFVAGADGANPAADLIYENGMLYGATINGGGTACNGYGCGTVFSINPNTDGEHVLYSFCSQKSCTDGTNPSASLITSNGKLYRTTSAGGGSGCNGSGCGTVFSISLTTGAEKVLYSFSGGTDGANPEDGLIEVNGILYGTTFDGGAYSYGTVFALKKY
jgi:uncharacterized repeat protein (TIGR03803 family)